MGLETRTGVPRDRAPVPLDTFVTFPREETSAETGQTATPVQTAFAADPVAPGGDDGLVAPVHAGRPRPRRLFPAARPIAVVDGGRAGTRLAARLVHGLDDTGHQVDVPAPRPLLGPPVAKVGAGVVSAAGVVPTLRRAVPTVPPPLPRLGVATEDTAVTPEGDAGLARPDAVDATEGEGRLPLRRLGGVLVLEGPGVATGLPLAVDPGVPTFRLRTTRPSVLLVVADTTATLVGETAVTAATPCLPTRPTARRPFHCLAGVFFLLADGTLFSGRPQAKQIRPPYRLIVEACPHPPFQKKHTSSEKKQSCLA